MKTNRLLRMLSLLAFLLLMAPFYDMCNGRGMKSADANAEVAVDSTAVAPDSLSAVIDTSQVNKVDIDTISNSVKAEEIPFYQKAYEFIDDDNSESAFEYSKIFIDQAQEFNYKEYKKGIKKDGCSGLFFHLKNLCFLFISILTFLNLIFSFSKKTNWIYKISKVNLILLFVTVICLFLEGWFETITQIKWGYYAFIITNILIFYYSKTNKSPILNRNS
ncbi:MAG: hypothetical protein ABIQ27_11760 [Flavobacterium sp.]|uniref:hypothetical protein n=1 Tax=Flavobacterium sp. TaxID=239 RepID=UPI0032658CDD